MCEEFYGWVPAEDRPPELPAYVFGFEVMLLKKAFVLCLKDEYTNSIKLLSPKGLYVISEAHLL